MIRITLLTSSLALIGVLGFLIDIQSRPRIERLQVTSRVACLSAPGRVEGASNEISLRLCLTERVKEVLVFEGQTVAAGDVLARLHDDQYRHELTLAAAELSLAEAERDRLVNGSRAEERRVARALYAARCAEMELARVSLRRIEALLESEAVSHQRADDVKAQLKAMTEETEAARARLELAEAPARPDELRISEAKIAAARARLELAQVPLERTTLRAPTSGQILEVLIEPGELAGPDTPQPALVMADTSRLRVRAFVDELDAPSVRKGMRARVTADGLPGESFSGTVARLGPKMTHKTVRTNEPTERHDTKTREVWIDLDTAEGLVLGLRVDVIIDTESQTRDSQLLTPVDKQRTVSEPMDLARVSARNVDNQ